MIKESSYYLLPLKPFYLDQKYFSFPLKSVFVSLRNNCNSFASQKSIAMILFWWLWTPNFSIVWCEQILFVVSLLWLEFKVMFQVEMCSDVCKRQSIGLRQIYERIEVSWVVWVVVWHMKAVDFNVFNISFNFNHTDIPPFSLNLLCWVYVQTKLICLV